MAMASTLGASSSYSSKAVLAMASIPFSSPSSKPLFPSLSFTPGKSNGRKYYGGIGIQCRKGRSQFHVKVTNVATDINSVEKVQKLADKGSQRPVYPFAAIVGQDEMKLCLLLNVIDPKIGGVMIMGDRGTGKSTAVRSLVDLLPEMKIVAGDPYNSDPEDLELMGVEVRERILSGEELPIVLTKINMVDLPLGATEDRVCGTIDIEKALTEGVKAFEPGLLAKANRGILYVDEVNLLDDHLVDVLLDSAASGWNTVEREGISISHPARFILIGSGNPEEGELRPQLLDRFGMHAQVGTVRDAELRVKIVEERAQFDKNPKEFRDSYQAEQEKLQQQIASARTSLSSVQIDHDLKVKISKVCAELNVDGLRGDIVTNRAAKALAALKGRDNVGAEDIATVIPNCLRHRLRKDPLESIDSGLLVIEKFYEVFS
uniref:Mg-protoporphyrin IX chelatase n=1 Tax=Rhizophora mucronata TaxID=61149 RepID=A0A2P2J8Q3_RHIMU